MTALTEQERESLLYVVREVEHVGEQTGTYEQGRIIAAVERILATRLAEADARIDSLTIAVKAMGKRADDAEAALERVRALADEWSGRWDVPEPGVLDMAAKHYRAAAGLLLIALDGDQP